MLLSFWILDSYQVFKIPTDFLQEKKPKAYWVRRFDQNIFSNKELVTWKLSCSNRELCERFEMPGWRARNGFIAFSQIQRLIIVRCFFQSFHRQNRKPIDILTIVVGLTNPIDIFCCFILAIFSLRREIYVTEIFWRWLGHRRSQAKQNDRTIGVQNKIVILWQPLDIFYFIVGCGLLLWRTVFSPFFVCLFCRKDDNRLLRELLFLRVERWQRQKSKSPFISRLNKSMIFEVACIW